MSADLNTEITIQGTKDELLAMLKVLRYFETEKYEQYRTQHNCGYIHSLKVRNGSDSYNLDTISDDELHTLIGDVSSELSISAAGPYGSFPSLEDVGLFEALAEAAPTASFNGQCAGFVTGADVSLTAELIAGALYLSNYYVCDDEIPERYMDMIQKKLPLTLFCKLFKVDEDDFDEDCYYDFLMEAVDIGFPHEMEFDTFLDICEASEIEEDDFQDALDKVIALNLEDFDSFRLKVDGDYITTRVYDPVTKKYT